MNLFGFSALNAAALFALIMPLVVLYFLKLKRPRLEIPSLLLWQRVLQDHRVNSPFQRFKRNILLLLQLLLLILLVLAAMQPFWRTDPYDTQRLPIILDTSASMSAVRRPGGPSRLEEAKTKARALINDLGGQQQIALIACSTNARRAAPFTNNRRVLLDALEQIDVDHLDSDLTEAFRMADAMARLEPFERVLLLSDGNIPDTVDFDLPFKLAYERLESAGPNVGIAAVNARRAPSGKWHVFVRVVASTQTPRTGTLSLVYNAETRADEDVVASIQRAPRLVFDVPGSVHASVELRLVPDEVDAMACDNVAYLELAPLRPLRAAVDPALPAFRHALQSIDHVDVVGFPEDGSAGNRLDLLVRGPDATSEARADVALHVGAVPDDLAEVIKADAAPTLVVDWRRDAPLLDHVNFSDLRVGNAPRFLPGKRESDLENLHYEVLVHGGSGPLILQREDGPVVAYHMLFHSDRSTLPYRVGFPVMVSNLARLAMRHAGLLEVGAARPHVLPPVTLHPGVTYQVHGPDGYRHEVDADLKGIVAGIPAPRVGRYAITKGGDDRAILGISLLSPFESQMTAVDAIAFTEMKVDVTTHRSRINKPLWPWFAAAALGVLLVEWWFFHRGGRTAVAR